MDGEREDVGLSSESEDDAQHAPRSTPENGTAPAKPKSAEALERERRLNDNFAKYENLSDQELTALVPKKEDGSPTSIGAMLHALGTCAPCSFYHFSLKGCNLGLRCKFCHDAHARSEKKRRKVNRKGKKDQGGDRDADERDAEDKVREAKRPRSAQLHWDDRLGQALDRNGNSRPCWLQDENLDEPCHRGAWPSPAMVTHHPGWPPPAGYSSFPGPASAPPVWPRR